MGRRTWRCASNELGRLVAALERRLEIEPDEIRARLLALQAAVDTELARR